MSHSVVAAARELGSLDALRVANTAFGDGNCTLAMETAIRLLFSCVIDADRRDASGRTEDAPSAWSPEDLLRRLDSAVSRLTRRPLDDRVRQLRNRVYDRCLEQASQPRGAFTLTVPTGGGKTLASMAFALKHASTHALDRVIVVIPYISIIEQNAAIYREIFGEDVVLEHHSNVAIPSEGESEDAVGQATEDWDARIIVTTSVRFFESLFSNRATDCRRVHRIANSVIIFDEVQTLPVGLMSPMLDMMKRLLDYMRSSLVLCTATQPALTERDGFPIGFTNCREIMGSVEDVRELFRLVEHRWRLPAGGVPKLTLQEVADRMSKRGRALAIVNTKRHARELFAILHAPRESGCFPIPLFHLSTAMCPAHRREVLDAVRSIPRDRPCLLVATQCVEAGVDLDFPLVLRALGPLDSCAQAAGRCNREGKGDGEFVIFLPEQHSMPPSIPYQSGAKLAGSMLSGAEPVDLADPACYARYFRSLYNIIGPDGWDEEQIQQMRAEWRFPEVARKFKLIEPSQSVIVNYGNALHLLELLRQCGPSKRLFRKLQQFSVNIYSRYAAEQKRLIEDGPFGLQLWISSFYDLDVGIRTELDVNKTVV